MKKLMLIMIILGFMAAPALAMPTIEFSPGTGIWSYNGAGTLSITPTVLIDRGMGSTLDALVVDAATITLPASFTVGGAGTAGPYTLTPIAGLITIQGSGGLYWSGTIGAGDLVPNTPTSTTAGAYTSYAADVTNGGVTAAGLALGSNALNVIAANPLSSLDFDLVLSGAPQSGWQNMLDNGLTGNDDFCAALTIIPAPVLDLTDYGNEGTINGAIFQQWDGQPMSTWVIDPFVRIQILDGEEEGYNTDGTIEFETKDDGGHNWTHSLLLSDLAIVTINGVQYREFMLSIDQVSGGDKNLLSLDELKIHLENAGNLTGYPASFSTPIYDLDAGGDNWIKLDSALNGGSGYGDMLAYIPNSLFSGGQYVYLYSKLGVYFQANDGFEEWAVRVQNKMTIPVEGKIARPSHAFRGYYDIKDYKKDDSKLNTLVFKETPDYPKGFREFQKEGEVIKKGVVTPYKRYKVYHEGIDIFAERDTPVYPAASGMIIYIDNKYDEPLNPVNDTDPAGKWIMIQHEDITKVDGALAEQISTRYLHLDDISDYIKNKLQENGNDPTNFVGLVNIPITRETAIGIVGNTGCRNVEPHLHFEVREGNNLTYLPNNTLPLNPCEFIDYSGYTTPPEEPTDRLYIRTFCPVDLIVTDPDGLIISKEINQLPMLAQYSEVKHGIEGEEPNEVPHDAVIIYERKIGDYSVTLISEPNAVPSDTYSLDATIDGQTMVLAEDVQIQDIPEEPYEFESKLNRSDFDNDGDVDFYDYATFASCWMSADCHYPDWCEGKDLDYSGLVDFIDLSIFTENWLWEKIIADIDIDGSVDFSDYAIFARAWLTEPNDPDWNAACDISYPTDNVIDMLDLEVFVENWLQSSVIED